MVHKYAGSQVRKEMLIKSLDTLKRIDKQLDTLEMEDPYGDLVQNFEDENRERETKRLIKLVEKDLEEYR